MKKDLLIVVLLMLAGTLAGQQLVLGTHDVVRLNEYPQDAYLIEADASSFYRVSGGFSTSSDHPLLGGALDPDVSSIYFIKYDREGVPLKANYVRGTNNVVYAASFKSGFTLMANSNNEVDADGTILPVALNSAVEYIANYDPDCQFVKIIDIWALTSNQYVNSEAIMDPEDGSVYVYGEANQPIELRGFGSLAKDLETPNSYAYLVKYNSDLELQWVYEFGFDLMQSGTSPYFDKIQVFPGKEGSALITGTYGTESSPLIHGRSLPSYMDGYGTFAVMINQAGQSQWVQDGNLTAYGYATRIFKAFPMPNGDFVLAGNTNTGYYSLGSTQFTFSDGQSNNQFVFRIDPAGNPVWTRRFESQGPVQEGKKKNVSSMVMNNNIFYDAISWRNRFLYLTAPFTNPEFQLDDKLMNLSYPGGIYVAALDLRDGTDVWAYALSSDDVQIYGFDADLAGNVSLMGYNYATQDLDGIVAETVVPGSFLFHVGLDYNGQPLWYSNVHLQNPPYSNLSGVDLEVLPNGEIFSSMKMNVTNDIVVGESTVSEGLNPNTSWLIELASDVIIGGRVTDAGDNPVYPGFVKAIKSTRWGSYPMVDSALLKEDGSYLFDGLYPGNYTLMAVPDPAQYPDDICTYTGDQTGWKSASFLDLYPKFNSNIVDIKLEEVSPFSPGNGSMSGTISLDSDVEDDLKATNARPAKKAAVVLLGKAKKSTMAGEVFAYVETDENGIFSFTDVPDGAYLLHVEVAGLEMLQMHDVTIVGDQIVSGLNYTISEDGIYIGWPVGLSLLENEELLIYPNPGKGLIIMDLPSAGHYVVNIYTTDGRMVFKEEFMSAGGARSFNISGENDGIYLIKLVGPETDETIKYLKR